MKCRSPKSATPIDADEVTALLPSGITTQSELNEVEETNILKAETWAFGRKHKDYLTIDFLKRLHKRMFDEVWRWAGTFRKTNKNLGVDKSQISIELKKLLDDTDYWIKNNTYGWEELGARFHHRLVSIHPFPNGNGRHARLMTDIVLHHNDQDRFSWGSGPITPKGQTRSTYISALQEADNQNLKPLVDFMRS